MSKSGPTITVTEKAEVGASNGEGGRREDPAEARGGRGEATATDADVDASDVAAAFQGAAQEGRAEARLELAASGAAEARDFGQLCLHVCVPLRCLLPRARAVVADRCLRPRQSGQLGRARSRRHGAARHHDHRHCQVLGGLHDRGSRRGPRALRREP